MAEIVTCVCCEQWRLERVLRDHLDGRGAREIWRLWRYRHALDDWAVSAEYRSLDKAVAGMDERGIVMLEEPADGGCE